MQDIKTDFAEMLPGLNPVDVASMTQPPLPVAFASEIPVNLTRARTKLDIDAAATQSSDGEGSSEQTKSEAKQHVFELAEFKALVKKKLRVGLRAI